MRHHDPVANDLAIRMADLDRALSFAKRFREIHTDELVQSLKLELAWCEDQIRTALHAHYIRERATREQEGTGR